jgi:AraC-like DNA-binding protein
MNIAETPIAAIRGSHRATGDGVHLVARRYRKGVRLDTHMHREAQLVYAAKGTVLADIEMRTLYFDLAWLAREDRSESLDCEFVVRVSRLLHETILALFDGQGNPDRTGLLVKLAVLELHHAEDSATFIPLPQEPRCRRAADIVLGDPTAAHEIETLAREVGTSARTLSRLFSSETQLSFKSWCQRARIAAAIERLSMQADVSVKQLASELGYASVPAFSHAFRQVTGKTPTQFAETK